MPEIKMSVPLDKKVRAALDKLAKADRRSAGSYAAIVLAKHVTEAAAK